MATMTIKKAVLCVGRGGHAGRTLRSNSCPYDRGYAYSATENSMFGIKEVQFLPDNYYSHTVMYFIP
jgi:hypothetical protein